jgi:hypothetical protein
MTVSRYVMHDQARDTVREIMCRPEATPPLVVRPSWLALALLLAAFNLLAVVAPG